MRPVPLAGYSGTPLVKKLGLKAGDTVCLLGAPTGFVKMLTPLPDGITFASKIAKTCDAVHLFTAKKTELARVLATCRKTLAPDAMIWISWPKKTSKLPSEITEDTIREVALPMGLVDVKVCAVDETWSGLKLMLRKELRGA